MTKNTKFYQFFDKNRIKSYFSTKRIAYLAIFVALAVVTNIFTITFSFMGSNAISFNYVPCFFAGIFLGPISGFIVGVMSDVLGCIIAPKGPWLPLITLASGLLGLIPGLVFKIKKVNPYILMAISIVIVFVVCTAGLNTLAIFLAYFKGKKTFFAYLGARVGMQAIVVAINTVLLYALYYPLKKLIFNSNLKISLEKPITTEKEATDTQDDNSNDVTEP